MLAWSEGADNGRQKTRNHGYDVIVGGGKLLLITPITLANLSKPKTQINRRRITSFPEWDAYRKQRPERLLSEKSGRCGIATDEERGALPMIDVVISVRQSTVAAISGLHCRALVMVSSSIRKADSLIAKFKEAGGTVREIDEQSHRDYLRSGYLHHRLPVMGC